MSFCIPVFQVEVVEQGGAFSGLDDSAAEIQAYQIGIESHMDPDNKRIVFYSDSMWEEGAGGWRSCSRAGCWIKPVRAGV